MPLSDSERRIRLRHRGPPMVPCDLPLVLRDSRIRMRQPYDRADIPAISLRPILAGHTFVFMKPAQSQPWGKPQDREQSVRLCEKRNSIYYAR